MSYDPERLHHLRGREGLPWRSRRGQEERRHDRERHRCELGHRRDRARGPVPHAGDSSRRPSTAFRSSARSTDRAEPEVSKDAGASSPGGAASHPPNPEASSFSGQLRSCAWRNPSTSGSATKCRRASRVSRVLPRDSRARASAAANRKIEPLRDRVLADARDARQDAMDVRRMPALAAFSRAFPELLRSARKPWLDELFRTVSRRGPFPVTTTRSTSAASSRSTTPFPWRS